MDSGLCFLALLTQTEAEFPIYFHCWIWLHADCNMGGGFDVCPYASRCDRIIPTDEVYRLLEQGLTDGGMAGLTWSFVIVAIGFLLVFLSLAEMASMYALSSVGSDSSCH